MKIGNYTADEILEFMTEGEGRGFLGRSMYDAIMGEIERLNKELETLKQPQVFIDTQDMEERYGEELYKEYLEKENKRLNNIINELGKYLIEEIEDYDKHINSQYITDITREQYEGEKVCFEDTLCKLQELKGSDR